MITPERDRAWCHTVAYSSAILAGAALAAEIAELDLDTEAISSYLRQAVTLGEAEREIARSLSGLTLVRTG